MLALLFVLLIIVYFGSLLGDFAMPVVVIGIICFALIKGIDLLEKKDFKNKYLEYKINAGMIVFGYMFFSALTGIRGINSIINICCYGAIVYGLYQLSKNNESGKKIVGIGMVVTGGLNTYFFIRTIIGLIKVVFQDFYLGSLNFSFVQPIVSSTYLLMLIVGLSILCNIKVKLAKNISYFIMACVEILPLAFAFIETSNIVLTIYYLLIALFYVWGINSVDKLVDNNVSVDKKKVFKLVTGCFIALTVFFSPTLISLPVASFGGSGSSTSINTCKSCGRSYKAGDAGGNYKNIAKTGMCKNCYDNYKWMQNQLGK